MDEYAFEIPIVTLHYHSFVYFVEISSEKIYTKRILLNNPIRIIEENKYD